MRDVDVAAIENLQRRQQLAAEKCRPPRIPGERRQRPNRRADAAELPEVRFKAPDADDDARRHAVTFVHFVEHLTVPRVHRLRCADELRFQLADDVFLEREDRFGLRPIALDDGRLGLVDRRQRLVDDLRPNPSLQCVGTDAGEPFRKRRPGGRLF